MVTNGHRVAAGGRRCRSAIVRRPLSRSSLVPAVRTLSAMMRPDGRWSTLVTTPYWPFPSSSCSSRSRMFMTYLDLSLWAASECSVEVKYARVSHGAAGRAAA